jgi:uncharacterized Zn-binding protein involved in type VI secretion
MTRPAAKEDDKIVATDIHLVQGSPASFPFVGTLDDNLSANVLVEKKPAAMVDSRATNQPPHIAPPGKSFDKPPTNRGVIITGSGTVLINDRAAARDEDIATTCNDPSESPVGKVVASGTVLVGS